MEPTITIARHYHGPPTSGNGGYTCGLIDAHTDYLSEVTLRKPIPLDLPMAISPLEDGHQMRANDTLIATARPGDLTDLEIPPPPTFAEATAASQKYLGHTLGTAFPTCFVCGEERPVGEGLHIYAGPVDGSDLYAAPWMPTVDLGDDTGQVKPEFVWAALDCPGAYASLGAAPKPILLGRMTAELTQPIQVGEACVITAWLINRDGRKSWSGTAIFNKAGALCGRAKATWFEIADG